MISRRPAPRSAHTCRTTSQQSSHLERLHRFEQFLVLRVELPILGLQLLCTPLAGLGRLLQPVFLRVKSRQLHVTLDVSVAQLLQLPLQLVALLLQLLQPVGGGSLLLLQPPRLLLQARVLLSDRLQLRAAAGAEVLQQVWSRRHRQSASNAHHVGTSETRTCKNTLNIQCV